MCQRDSIQWLRVKKCIRKGASLNFGENIILHDCNTKWINVNKIIILMSNILFIFLFLTILYVYIINLKIILWKRVKIVENK